MIGCFVQEKQQLYVAADFHMRIIQEVESYEHSSYE